MRSVKQRNEREFTHKQTKIGVFIRQPWNLNNGSSYQHKNFSGFIFSISLENLKYACM